jgi:anaerobic selenocysteine-containing dehydrogenase
MFAESKPAAIMSGASPTVHHTNAVQNHRAITALIGLTGNFDRKGGNYVQATSYYHQPTGLPTREREFEQVRPFEAMAPRIGQDAHPVWCQLVSEAQSMHLPFQINTQTPYPIRAMVGFGVNHRMWPGSDYMRDSLKKLDFMVDVDLFLTDTAKLADLVLPACSAFEKNDLRIWPSRYAIWTRPVIAPVGEARSDIDIIIDMADKLGLSDPLLSQGHEACLDWMFAPAGLKIRDIKDHPQGCFLENTTRPPYEKYKTNGFPTPSGKMEFTSSILQKAGFDPLPTYTEPALSPVSTPAVAENYPLVLTTGARLPMFFHSRTFRLPWTRRLRPDPMLEIHPQDAQKRGIAQGDVVNLSTPRASITVKANLTRKVPAGVVNMLHGYPEADVNLLIEPDYRDPISGFPGFKALLCQVSLKTV